MGNRRSRPPRRGLPSYGPAQARQRMRRSQRFGRLKAIANSQRAAGVVFILFAVFFGTWAVLDIDQKQYLGVGSLVAQATVVGVHDAAHDSSVTVEFAPQNGPEVRAEVSDFYWDPTPRVGDVARVRYDPDDPIAYVRNDRMGPGVLLTVLLALFSMAFFAAGVAGWRRHLPSWVLKRY
jgi:Protein of unknown function (DUF3592)